MNPTTSYAEKQERKRKLTSIGITAGLYLLAFALGLVLEILNPREEDYSNMTVMITMPGPTTNEVGLGSFKPSEEGEKAEKVEPSAPKKTETVLEKAEAPKVESLKKPVEEATPSPSKAVAPAAPPPEPAPKPKDTVAVAAAPTQPSPGAPSAIQPAQAASIPESTVKETPPAEPWVPGQREQGSHISQTSTMLYVPGKGLVPYSGDTVTIRKSEKGSSSDTTLGGSQGTVGQNIYQPVYSSLPLPRTVPASVYNAIPDLVIPPNVVIYSAQARKRAFTTYYDFDGSAYRLKTEVPLEQREPLWQILEDAGYDPAKTEYRESRSLNPVVIGFTVTKDNQLRGAEVLQSSGDSQIDQAVLYGFKRSVFWNKTGETVPGRFTYRF
ncbi:MAG: energy transducer TonB [Spirochaetia bacterium]|nr:energy transducer TonB [Spirochaetia bacterium]MCE1209132.1 energy transducer TonB [Spirochaetia bacterium]